MPPTKCSEDLHFPAVRPDVRSLSIHLHPEPSIRRVWPTVVPVHCRTVWSH